MCLQTLTGHTERGLRGVKHGVTVTEVNEALRDPNQVIVNPDPKGRSGDSVRVTGCPPTEAKC